MEKSIVFAKVEKLVHRLVRRRERKGAGGGWGDNTGYIA